jgi:hypothetical protein
MPVDRVAQLLAVMERNNDIEIAAEEDAAPKISGIYICGAPRPPKVKIDRSLENELLAQLSPTERKELERLCKEKAKEAWRAGDRLRKIMWGGW